MSQVLCVCCLEISFCFSFFCGVFASFSLAFLPMPKLTLSEYDSCHRSYQLLCIYRRSYSQQCRAISSVWLQSWTPMELWEHESIVELLLLQSTLSSQIRPLPTANLQACWMEGNQWLGRVVPMATKAILTAKISNHITGTYCMVSQRSVTLATLIGNTNIL